MQNVTIVTADQLVIVDGRPLNIPFQMGGEWAVQFNGISAEVEYTDNRPNELIDEPTFTARYGAIVQAHADEAARLDAAAAAQEPPA